MATLDHIVSSLDSFFAVRDLAQDPVMSRNLPRVHDAIDFDFRNPVTPFQD